MSLGFLSLRLLSCPVTGVNEASVFEYYSLVRSPASPGLERFCDKVPQLGKKTRAFFLATFGILAESSLSLKTTLLASH